MSECDEMGADKLSREVAERRRDRKFSSRGDQEKWAHPDAKCYDYSDRPQPYASELWACGSLLEELDALGGEVTVRRRSRGGYRADYNEPPLADASTCICSADTRPEATARLWLSCHDAGLFDDEGGGDDELEYTDEELAEACESARTAPMHKLQSAADRLRELSGAADKLDEIRDLLGDTTFGEDSDRNDVVGVVRDLYSTLQTTLDERERYKETLRELRDALPSALDGFGLVEAVEALVEEREAYRKFGEARFQSGTSTAIPKGDQGCSECERPLPSVTWPQIQFKMIHCPCGACYELSDFTWDRVESASYEYDPADCPWLGQSEQVDGDNGNRNGLTGDAPDAAEMLEELKAWLEEQLEMYGIARCSNRPSVLATQYENVLDKLDKLTGGDE